jgi:hypothetical protein
MDEDYEKRDNDAGLDKNNRRISEDGKPGESSGKPQLAPSAQQPPKRASHPAFRAKIFHHPDMQQKHVEIQHSNHLRVVEAHLFVTIVPQSRPLRPLSYTPYLKSSSQQQQQQQQQSTSKLAPSSSSSSSGAVSRKSGNHATGATAHTNPNSRGVAHQPHHSQLPVGSVPKTHAQHASAAVVAAAVSSRDKARLQQQQITQAPQGQTAVSIASGDGNREVAGNNGVDKDGVDRAISGGTAIVSSSSTSPNDTIGTTGSSTVIVHPHVPSITESVQECLACGLPSTSSGTSTSTSSSLFTSPQDSAAYIYHAQRHLLLRPFVSQEIRRRHLARRQRWQQLAAQYKRTSHCWEAHIYALENPHLVTSVDGGSRQRNQPIVLQLQHQQASSSSSSSSFSSSLVGREKRGSSNSLALSTRGAYQKTGNKPFHELSDHMPLTESAGLSHNASSKNMVARSDGEQEKLLHELLAHEKRVKRWEDNRARIPAMKTPFIHPVGKKTQERMMATWSAEIRPITFIASSGLHADLAITEPYDASVPFLDNKAQRLTTDGRRQVCAGYPSNVPCPINCNCAVQVERMQTFERLWTDIEKCIFLDKFVQYPKNFFRIAQFLPNRTTRDCVKFYYDAKATMKFKPLLKEYEILRRKLKASMNSAGSVSVGGGGGNGGGGGANSGGGGGGGANSGVGNGSGGVGGGVGAGGGAAGMASLTATSLLTQPSPSPASASSSNLAGTSTSTSTATATATAAAASQVPTFCVPYSQVLALIRAHRRPVPSPSGSSVTTSGNGGNAVQVHPPLHWQYAMNAAQRAGASVYPPVNVDYSQAAALTHTQNFALAEAVRDEQHYYPLIELPAQDQSFETFHLQPPHTRQTFGLPASRLYASNTLLQQVQQYQTGSTKVGEGGGLAVGKLPPFPMPSTSGVGASTGMKTGTKTASGGAPPSPEMEAAWAAKSLVRQREDWVKEHVLVRRDASTNPTTNLNPFASSQCIFSQNYPRASTIQQAQRKRLWSLLRYDEENRALMRQKLNQQVKRERRAGGNNTSTSSSTNLVGSAKKTRKQGGSSKSIVEDEDVLLPTVLTTDDTEQDIMANESATAAAGSDDVLVAGPDGEHDASTAAAAAISTSSASAPVVHKKVPVLTVQKPLRTNAPCASVMLTATYSATQLASALQQIPETLLLDQEEEMAFQNEVEEVLSYGRTSQVPSMPVARRLMELDASNKLEGGLSKLPLGPYFTYHVNPDLFADVLAPCYRFQAGGAQRTVTQTLPFGNLPSSDHPPMLFAGTTQPRPHHTGAAGADTGGAGHAVGASEASAGAGTNPAASNPTALIDRSHGDVPPRPGAPGQSGFAPASQQPQQHQQQQLQLQQGGGTTGRGGRGRAPRATKQQQQQQLQLQQQIAARALAAESTTKSSAAVARSTSVSSTQPEAPRPTSITTTITTATTKPMVKDERKEDGSMKMGGNIAASDASVDKSSRAVKNGVGNGEEKEEEEEDDDDDDDDASSSSSTSSSGSSSGAVSSSTGSVSGADNANDSDDDVDDDVDDDDEEDDEDDEDSSDDDEGEKAGETRPLTLSLPSTYKDNVTKAPAAKPPVSSSSAHPSNITKSKPAPSTKRMAPSSTKVSSSAVATSTAPTTTLMSITDAVAAAAALVGVSPGDMISTPSGLLVPAPLSTTVLSASALAAAGRVSHQRYRYAHANNHSNTTTTTTTTTITTNTNSHDTQRSESPGTGAVDGGHAGNGANHATNASSGSSSAAYSSSYSSSHPHPHHTNTTEKVLATGAAVAAAALIQRQLQQQAKQLLLQQQQQQQQQQQSSGMLANDGGVGSAAAAVAVAGSATKKQKRASTNASSRPSSRNLSRTSPVTAASVSNTTSTTTTTGVATSTSVPATIGHVVAVAVAKKQQQQEEKEEDGSSTVPSVAIAPAIIVTAASLLEESNRGVVVVEGVTVPEKVVEDTNAVGTGLVATEVVVLPGDADANAAAAVVVVVAVDATASRKRKFSEGNTVEDPAVDDVASSRVESSHPGGEMMAVESKAMVVDDGDDGGDDDKAAVASSPSVIGPVMIRESDGDDRVDSWKRRRFEEARNGSVIVEKSAPVVVESIQSEVEAPAEAAVEAVVATTKEATINGDDAP